LVSLRGRKPNNSGYAGKTHPSGVQFTKEGFPEFSPFAKARVELRGLTGNTTAYLDGGAISDALAGNGPLLVNSRGTVRQLPPHVDPAARSQPRGAIHSD
jgi:hypothetical protein